MTYQIISERKAKYETTVTGPRDAFTAIRRYAENKQEQFIVITLNGAHKIERVILNTIGLVNRTVVHPREVFKEAIKDSAAAIIVAHNHPSGNLVPSAEDNEVTERIKKAGDILGIPMLDHMVFNGEGYYSYLEERPHMVGSSR